MERPNQPDDFAELVDAVLRLLPYLLPDTVKAKVAKLVGEEGGQRLRIFQLVAGHEEVDYSTIKQHLNIDSSSAKPRIKELKDGG